MRPVNQSETSSSVTGDGAGSGEATCKKDEADCCGPEDAALSGGMLFSPGSWRPAQDAVIVGRRLLPTAQVPWCPGHCPGAAALRETQGFAPPTGLGSPGGVPSVSGSRLPPAARWERSSLSRRAHSFPDQRPDGTDRLVRFLRTLPRDWARE